MCRNIKTLYNFEPAATHEEIEAAALQFVRKLTGYNKPSQVNEAAFYDAVDGVTEVSTRLLDSLVTRAPARNRQLENEKAKARSAARFGQS